jgi:hypothetical protein
VLPTRNPSRGFGKLPGHGGHQYTRFHNARAADGVLDHSAKAIEIRDIDKRVSELERAAEQAKSSGQ